MRPDRHRQHPAAVAEGRRRDEAGSPDIGMSAAGVPSASAAGAQPEPRITATSWCATPVRSAMTDAACSASGPTAREPSPGIGTRWVRYCGDANDHPSTRAEDVVAARRGDLIELSHSIHAEPELAFDEHRSCAKTQALAAERVSRSPRRPAGCPPPSAPTTGRAAGDRHLRRVRRAAGHRARLRAQHHRRLGRRHRAGAGRRRRRPRADRRAHRHPGRGVRRRQGPADRGRGVRRRRRRGDAAPGPIDIAGRALAGALGGDGHLHRPRVARRRRAVPRRQRRRRGDRRPGGDRAAAPAAGARADDPRNRHRGRLGHQRHPGPRGCSTRCGQETARRAGRWRTGCAAASRPVRWPPAAHTRSSRRRRRTPSWPRPVAGRGVPRRDGADGPRSGARRRRGRRAAGQYRHGQRHAAAARHPSRRRHRRRGAVIHQPGFTAAPSAPARMRPSSRVRSCWRAPSLRWPSRPERDRVLAAKADRA